MNWECESRQLKCGTREWKVEGSKIVIEFESKLQLRSRYYLSALHERSMCPLYFVFTLSLSESNQGGNFAKKGVIVYDNKS